MGLLPKGIEYLGDWTSATRYKVNDVVKDQAQFGFVQLTPHLCK